MAHNISFSETKSPAFSSHSSPSSDVADLESVTRTVTQTLINQKALDIMAYDLRGLTDLLDYVFVASGTSARHVHGMFDKTSRALRSIGERPLSVSGLEKSEWILLDYGNFAVHLFYEPVRQYYRLEELWTGGKPVALPDDLAEQVKRSRTGAFVS